jgi:regulator of sirC expression with transglutaminase-like and TPR domain
MNQAERKELQALVLLLEDPDPEIFDTVSKRLAEIGSPVIPALEKRWEITLKPELQERIENVIRKIQFDEVREGLENWRESGGKDLLYGAYLVARLHYPELDYSPLEAKIEKIRKDIWLELNSSLTALEKVRVINYFLYKIHRFDRSEKKTHTPHLYMVNHLLDTHRGSPVLLGLIYAELARRLDLPIYGVNLPRNFVLCFVDQEYLEDPNGILFYINPSDNGTALGLRELRFFLNQVNVVERDFYFQPCTNIDIVERLLVNLQFAYNRSGDPEKAEMIHYLLRKGAE